MLPDHPDIQSALRTGYPTSTWEQEERYFCSWCGKEITDEEIYEDKDNDYLCEECLKLLHKKEWD